MANYTNSPLTTYTKISPNRTSPRNHTIDTITIHCFVGQVTAQSGCNAKSFTKYNPISGASCNYVVGYDGSVGLCVEEKDRSWCSSNRSNDMRAVTIETASETEHPYKVTDAALDTLIELIADICRRNGKTKILWFGDREKTLAYEPKTYEMCMTVHRWFKNKACPGDYLYGRHSYIADEVNKRIGGSSESRKAAEVASVTEKTDTPFRVRVLIDDLNYRSEPSMSGKVMGVTGKGIFTIMETQNGWGKLKSGAGWIYLENSEYCTILK